ncbi:putative protein kinase RLK-Pelle-DLSV family [Helianthus annuus]|nr:putative protein kinase RLK-Pelle-DLSV family [Helianthus annuus]KAJ0516533.1 putative protein kinase RLK-Pelle-DLSV family [Helianthus annuus]
MEERRVPKTRLIFGFLGVLYASITSTHAAAHTISANQTLRYNETIVSPQETFELGFFSPPNSMNHYIGIWYKKISNRTVVWVANRDRPLTNTSGELTLTLQGVLVLRDATMGKVVWLSTNSSSKIVRNPIGQLLDTGNFIIHEEDEINQENPIWQSFDLMTDTLLPEMKVGWNLVTRTERHYTSWKSVEDPASERLLWVDSINDWNIILAPESDICDRYEVCGPFGSCNIDNTPVCECLKGFEPKSPDQWRVADWSQGCRRTIPLDCEPGEGFNKYSNLKLPDTRGSWYNQTMSLVECEKIWTGSGCLLWYGDLVDIRTVPQNGDTLYIRVPHSEIESTGNIKHSGVGRRRIQVIVPVAFLVLITLVSICLFYRFNKKKQQPGRPGNENNSENRSSDEDFELPLFGLSVILEATNNFSLNNKLGEGGFGPVYKGVLEDEKEIAVKRLAKTSTQGLHEFKNEVISISRLQHRNLVKLFGCCIEGTEKMLIYEYMPNKGLDSFLFDKTQSQLLDWPARYHIINGIARGLVYLHQDSRLRIIHRDLKVSNILLDKDMNPKISDFGMARTFAGNQIEANTNRVVGTYGYMAPEYAGDGIFSIKSDVYSFGVIMLEIVCGEKNRGFVHKEHCNNLIGYAWELHNEDKSLQLVAKCLGESINVSQVLRSIHIGLLCVQRHPEDRPTMTSVILMLGSEGPLPSPKEPGFYIGKTKHDTTQSSSSYGTSSNNELSISMLNGR